MSEGKINFQAKTIVDVDVLANAFKKLADKYSTPWTFVNSISYDAKNAEMTLVLENEERGEFTVKGGITFTSFGELLDAA